MSTFCLECNKEVANGLDLCPQCEDRHALVETKFQDFWNCLSYDPLVSRRDPSTMDSKVVHLTQEEAGIVFPSWVEERSRILQKCGMSQPACLADYIYFTHQVCIDRFIRRGEVGYWNALVIVTSFFNKDWCVKRYYDPGRDADKKKGIPARTRGWKVAIFNPFNYMEWAMSGFKEWIVAWFRAGVTRKQLIQKAEEVIKQEVAS